VRLTLGQAAEVRLGRQRAPQYEAGDSIVPYLRSANVTDGALDLTDVKSMNFTPEEQRVFRLAPGDVLVTEGSGSRDTVGTSAVWNADFPDPVCFQNTLLRLRPRLGVTDGRYLAWWARYARSSGQIAAVSSGANILHIGSDGLKRLRITVPSLSDQRRIADFLDDRLARIDRIIAARREQLLLAAHAYDSRREAVFLGAATGRDMQLRRLNCVVQTGPFGSQLHSEEYVDSGWPVVNPTSISRGRLRAVPGMAINGEVRARLQRHILREGDIVFGRRGELGRAGLVTSEEVGWVCGTGSLLVRLKDVRVLSAYVAEVLATSAARHYFRTQSVGSTMDNLNTEILMSVPLRIPSVTEQGRILGVLARVAAEMHATKNDLTESIDLLAEYKSSLITAAVTGELDVTTAGSGVPA